MKKTILISMVFVLMFCLLPSCAAGVSQAEYDKLRSDLTAAQIQIQSLQSELSTKEIELTTKGHEVEATKSELESVTEKLLQGKARIEIINAILIPAMTGELDRMTESGALNYFLDWRDKIKAVEDPTLTAKFDTMIETLSDEDSLSFFVYLLESTADALE